MEHESYLFIRSALKEALGPFFGAFEKGMEIGLAQGRAEAASECYLTKTEARNLGVLEE